jgi:hypothetical protein
VKLLKLLYGGQSVKHQDYAQVLNTLNLTKIFLEMPKIELSKKKIKFKISGILYVFKKCRLQAYLSESVSKQQQQKGPRIDCESNMNDLFGVFFSTNKFRSYNYIYIKGANGPEPSEETGLSSVYADVYEFENASLS